MKHLSKTIEHDQNGSLIVGGGVVGLALAVALHQQGIACTLIEANQATPPPRAIALTRKSLSLLKAWGILSALETTPILGVALSLEGSTAKPYLSDGEAIGAIVPLPALHAALIDRVEALGIPFYQPVSVDSATAVDQHWSVHLTDGRVLKTALLIGADGADSLVRQACGIGARKMDTGHVGLVGRIQFEKAHQGVAFERLGKRGDVLALLPLADGQMSYVWSYPKDGYPYKETPTACDYQKDFQTFFGQSLGLILNITPPRTVSFEGLSAQSQVARRCVLMGHAAHMMHPIGAQGLNLSFRDIEVLVALLASGGDLGRPDRLAAYQVKRLPDQQATMSLTTILSDLLSSKRFPFSAKAIGLHVLRHAAPVQRRLLSLMSGASRDD